MVRTGLGLGSAVYYPRKAWKLIKSEKGVSANTKEVMFIHMDG